MIFVTTGTCVSFDRFLKKINDLTLELDNEKVIAQIGETVFEPTNCEYFRYAPSLEKYYKKARLIISHGGFSTMEIIKAQKPLIVVPRQKRYGEHFDNHQVEFAELLYKKLGVKFLMDINELTVELVKNYNYIVNFDNENLLHFREKVLLDLLCKK